MCEGHNGNFLTGVYVGHVGVMQGTQHGVWQVARTQGQCALPLIFREGPSLALRRDCYSERLPGKVMA